MGGFANNAPIVTDGLVFYVDAGNSRSYPGSGTTWSDLIGSNDGTLTNGPTYSSDNGGSIVFDGSNDYYRYDVDWTSYSDITAIAWIKKSSYGNSWENYFSYGSEDAGLTRGWGIRRSGSTNKYQYWGGNESTGIQLYINDGLDSSSSGTINTTADGVNVLNQWEQITITAQGVSNFHQNRLAIAVRNDSLNGSFSNPQVSNLKVYNRILSAAEITQNYNALKNRFV